MRIPATPHRDGLFLSNCFSNQLCLAKISFLHQHQLKFFMNDVCKLQPPLLLFKTPDFCSLVDTLDCYLNHCAWICNTFKAQINTLLLFDFCLLTLSVNNLFEVNSGLEAYTIFKFL